MIVTTLDAKCVICHGALHPAEVQLFGIHVKCLAPPPEPPRPPKDR
jgi:hypothetical protein